MRATIRMVDTDREACALPDGTTNYCEQCNKEDVGVLFWSGDGQLMWSDGWYCFDCLEGEGEAISR